MTVRTTLALLGILLWAACSEGGPDGSGGPGDTATDPGADGYGASATLSTGGAHSCAMADGRMYCWGRNDAGQLGDGTLEERWRPVEVIGEGGGSPFSDWERVAAGSQHTCGLRSGEIWCWGVNTNGALGDGTRDDRIAPVRVVGPEGATPFADWDDVSAGTDVTCGLRAGEVWCWGSNADSTLGTGADDDELRRSLTPVQVLSDTGESVWSDWDSVAVAGGGACGLRGGEAWCWGDDDSGQTGDGEDSVAEELPRRVTAGAFGSHWSDWDAVQTGGGHACGLRGGEVWCWGRNTSAQLGQGEPSLLALDPVRVLASDGGEGWSDWDRLAVGRYTCGLRGGTAYCWGTVALGDPSLPTAVASEGGGEPWSDWDAISVSSVHSCGWRAGEVWCWGRNARGGLGDGTADDSPTPVRVDLGL